MLSVLYTESHNQVLYTEFIMLSVVMLMLSVVMLNVAAPNKQAAEVWKNWFNLKTLFFNGDFVIVIANDEVTPTTNFTLVTYVMD
jgi:hypothetical protein